MSTFTTDLHIFFVDYWPHLAVALSVAAGAAAAIHAAMTKRDVRAAIGWVALTLFSPLLGALFYLVAGVNRVRYSKLAQLRDAADPLVRRHDQTSDPALSQSMPAHLASLIRLGDHVSQFPVLAGNRIQPLMGGDETYPAMLEAIRGARRSVVLGSYIFDNDPVGRDFVSALHEAQERGVEVRVLIDSIGARYSRPPITRLLREAGIPVALFMSDVLGLRLAYANLRSHRKLLVVDGRLAFTGGMNIRAGFMAAYAPAAPTRDAHFRVEGPAVSQLMLVFAHDWEFTTGENLRGATVFNASEVLACTAADPSAQTDGQGLLSEPTGAESGGIPLRVVASGPDRNIGRTHDMLLGALASAQQHVRLQTPYFLPDVTLISAMTIAARRGVRVDVVIPDSNNLRLVDYAMTAQLDQLIEMGVRVWRATGTFDHAKLLTIDGVWSYVGSSNLDSRSLRLNFELDIEVHDRQLAAWIADRIDAAVAQAKPVTLEALKAMPFPSRLRNKIIWLASPYL
ncbi:MAG: phosphatidylserine/phosphatidylglycerophosphate/cardiolipin synthase family protein [Pigmentiphaga sp.]